GGAAGRAVAARGRAPRPVTRDTRAMVARIRAGTARGGWEGANQVKAPVYPSASRAIVWQTGHPTANHARMPAALPARAPCFSDRSAALWAPAVSARVGAGSVVGSGSWSGRT